MGASSGTMWFEDSVSSAAGVLDPHAPSGVAFPQSASHDGLDAVANQLNGNIAASA